MIGVGSKVITISKHGIYWWREDQTGMTAASDQFLPLWDPNQVNLGQLALWCAGRKGNRAMFSLTRAGSTANDLAVEYHPDQGWLAPRSDAMSCYATSTGTAEVLYGGSPTVSGQCYELDTGGDDDGTGISFRFQTRWFELSTGFQAVVWQVRAHGRGTGTLTMLRDYTSGGGDQQPFSLDGSPSSAVLVFDSGDHWDAGLVYEIPAFQNTEPFLSLGVCRQFSLKFAGTATTTTSAAQVLGAGSAPDVGEFALFGLEWLFAPLGLS